MFPITPIIRKTQLRYRLVTTKQEYFCAYAQVCVFNVLKILSALPIVFNRIFRFNRHIEEKGSQP